MLSQMCSNGNNSENSWPQSHCVHRTTTIHCRMLAPTSGGYWGRGEIGAALSWGSRAAPILSGSQTYQYYIFVNHISPHGIGTNRADASKLRAYDFAFVPPDTTQQALWNLAWASPPICVLHPRSVFVDHSAFDQLCALGSINRSI